MKFRFLKVIIMKNLLLLLNLLTNHIFLSTPNVSIEHFFRKTHWNTVKNPFFFQKSYVTLQRS